MPSFTTRQLAQRIEGELVGDADLPIQGVDQIDRAAEGQLTFVRDQKNAERWPRSQASAVLVTRGVEVEPVAGKAIILVKDADQALTDLLPLFAPPMPRPAPGIHERAVVHDSAVIGKDVTIGPGCVIGAQVRIGDGCVLHANVVIMDESTIGERCELFPGVTIRQRCTIGHDVILHANVVIGTDGFGYTPRPAADGQGVEFVKIPHIGTVRIGNHVELGAGTCVDRGKFAATVIGDGCKLDNLCQIGHNVQIGRSCVLSGQVGVAGSAVIGDNVMIGGKTAIKDNITIGSGAKIAAVSAVMNDIPAGESWGGYPAREFRIALREVAAVRKLPELIRKLGR